MAEWKTISIKEVITELPKSQIQVQQADNVGPYPFFTSGEKILSHSKFIVEDALIFMATGGKANVKFYHGKAAYSTDTYALKSKTEDTEYVFNLLLSKINYIDKNFFSGSGLKHLQKRDFKNYILEIPSEINEQHQISHIFSLITKAETTTKQLISKHQRIKTGMLYDLLTRGIDKHGNLRSEETHQFKDSSLGRIPVEWDDSTIQKSCLVRNQYRKPISQDVRAGMMGEYRYYGPTGILDYLNEYLVEGKYVLLGEDGDHFLKYLYQEQTILVEGKFNVNNHAHILEGTKSCLTEWIHLFFSHRDITLFLTRQGAGRYKLNKNSLLNLGIAIPPIQEQREILKRFTSLKIKHQKDISQLSKLKSLKTGLMQDLLSGKIRLPEELLLREGIE